MLTESDVLITLPDASAAEIEPFELVNTPPLRLNI